MIHRRFQQLVQDRLEEFPAVALLGPRQAGKTTLAEMVADLRPSLYLDLKSPTDRSKLSDPELYLSAHQDKLVIIDEVQRTPALFEVLRGLIDRGRRKGRRTGQFLLLGSASMDLLRQSGESLAGRIAYIELPPLDVLEVPPNATEKLWLRGGFPDSFLATNDRRSLIWRENFIRTYLERDIPMLGPRIPAETLRRFWTMLAHGQSTLLNAAQLARGLAVDGKTVARYLDLLVDLLLVRRLPPWHTSTKKRLVKSPKILVRDSGVAHALLGIGDREALLGHPVAGLSWEAFVTETLINAAPDRTVPSFYRTAAGAEIDLMLEIPGQGLWAIEIKSGLTPKLEKGFYQARLDLQPDHCFAVYAGSESYPLGDGVEATGLMTLAKNLAAMS
ncbi:MAG: ATPase [Desulfobacterales bacterium CG2_30_60_27]|nr:MAG: ATPase [Desulfobacterales bacterium CG2_30_60_27]